MKFKILTDSNLEAREYVLENVGTHASKLATFSE